MTAGSDKLTLEMKRVLPASPPDVFAAFSEPNELVKWWGPEGFSTSSLEFQPRVGESYRIEMQPPEGDPFYLTGEFREVDPPARLAYTFVYEDPDPTTSRPSSTCHFGISANRRRSPNAGAVQDRGAPRASTAAVGGTVSTSSSSGSRPRSRSQPGRGLPTHQGSRDIADGAYRLQIDSIVSETCSLLTRVMYKAVLGLHYRREEQKKSGQLTIF